MYPSALYYTRVPFIVPECPLLYPSAPYCTRVPLIAPECPLLYPSAPYCTRVPLIVPECLLLYPSAPYCTRVPLIIPECLLFVQKGSLLVFVFQKCPIDMLYFFAENLAYLPYNTQEEPLFVMHHCDMMVSLSGPGYTQSFHEVKDLGIFQRNGL